MLADGAGMVAVMQTWRSEHTYELCTFRSLPDFQLTGRRPRARGDEFTVVDSEYADDTGLPFCSRADVEEQAPLVMRHFERWGMEVHAGTMPQRVEASGKPEAVKDSKSEILFCAAPAHVYSNPSTFDGADLSPVLMPGGRFMAVVDKFKYLGKYLSRTCSCAMSRTTSCSGPSPTTDRPLCAESKPSCMTSATCCSGWVK